MRLGCHIKISGGLVKAVDRAVERGCETMQVFVSNPRGWRQSDILPADIADFRERCAEADIRPVFVHTIYLINLASPSDEVWEKSIKTLLMNMKAASEIGSAAVVTHLGSHGGEGEEYGVERVRKALERIFSEDVSDVPVLLETTAGSGHGVGHKFDHLGGIIRSFEGENLGLCFDTCHVFAAGYEVRDRAGLEETLRELDREVGMERLRLVHANDSKAKKGSRVDRHEHIGKGEIGLEAFRSMINHPALSQVPWILETPEMTVERDRENLRILRSLLRDG